MLSVGVVAAGGVGYYVETVGSGLDDYYARTRPGVWMGSGAGTLGVEGSVVDASQIDRLAAGAHPVTGEPLGVRTGKVAAFDLTFSAPKSVSLLAELTDADTRTAVRDGHNVAVSATVRFLEQECVISGRRGHNGVTRIATTGAVAAGFVHRTSRAGDPQLHTHVLLFNRAQGTDGRWRGIDGRRVFAWAKTAGYVYQAALRAELTERLGVDWRPVHNGMADTAGFTDPQLAFFSSRRAQVEAALAETGHSTARAAQLATLATRPATPEPVDPDLQREQWRAAAADAGITPEAVEEKRRHPLAPDSLELNALTTRLAGPAGLTEHTSAFDRRDVIRALAEASSSGIRPDGLRGGADSVLADDRFALTGRESHHAGPLHSTVELMETEARLLASAHERQIAKAGVCTPATVEASISARPSLTDEQQAMVRRLCGSGRGVEVVVGRAGTGKTFALDAARHAWEQSGYTVVGTALAARTAAGLQAGTGIASTTVDQLLADSARPGPSGVLPRRGVLVVDEAGMVGTRKLAAVLDAAEKSRVKVVLVGDFRQLPEVEAGGAFAELAKHDPIQLTANRRQAEAWERQALDELRHGDVSKAVTLYSEHRRITLADTAESTRQALVADWWNAGGDPERHLMVALQRADVDDLNQRARTVLRGEGLLGADLLVTEAGLGFAEGDRVMALRNDRRLGLLNGTRATVTGAAPEGGLLVTTVDGRDLVVPGDYLDAGHLTHGYALTVHKTQGLTVARAFVLGSDRLYREAGYSALSRAIERTDLYHVRPAGSRWEPAQPSGEDDLARLLGRSDAQTLATAPSLVGSQRLTNPQRLPDEGTRPLDRAAIRDAALADPGAHLLDRLGPPPTSGPSRDAWAAAATAIDAYRARHHPDGPDPLGPAPAEPTARREWEHAQSAAAAVDRQRHIDLGHDLSL